MGLFDTIKKSKEVNKKAEWRIGGIPTVVELHDDHMKIYNSAVENIVFYKDIMDVQVVRNIVNIRTNVKTYSLQNRKIRGGSPLAVELQGELLAKMSVYKQ